MEEVEHALFGKGLSIGNNGEIYEGEFKKDQ